MGTSPITTLPGVSALRVGLEDAYSNAEEARDAAEFRMSAIETATAILDRIEAGDVEVDDEVREELVSEVTDAESDDDTSGLYPLVVALVGEAFIIRRDAQRQFEFDLSWVASSARNEHATPDRVIEVAERARVALTSGLVTPVDEGHWLYEAQQSLNA